MWHFFMNTIIVVFQFKHLISKRPDLEILNDGLPFCIFKTDGYYLYNFNLFNK